MLRVRGLSAGYTDLTVFSDVSFELDRGETLSIVGPSGCGKSTLLLVLSGMKTPAAGSARINDQVTAGRTGLVLQSYGLFPWFTARRNVELALEISSRHRDDRRPTRELRESWSDAADRALRQVGLGERGASFPGQLSGGQQQRVALARTLATTPELLLLDEPFSALDALTREELQETLLGVLAQRSAPAILVTHSVEEAVFLGDRVGVLAGSPARLLVRPNPAGPGQGISSHLRRESSQYQAACAAVRAWFREQVSA